MIIILFLFIQVLQAVHHAVHHQLVRQEAHQAVLLVALLAVPQVLVS